jgi:hypothetical protein
MTIRLPRPRLFASPFSFAGVKRGVSRDGTSSPIPGPPPQPISEVSPVMNCALCAKMIAHEEATVQIRHGATSQDPTPPLLPAHARCFRNELLPKW